MISQADAAALSRLRARFIALLALEGAAGAIALMLLIGYFALRAGWCLPAFALVLAAAVAAQVAFIAAFRRDLKKGA